MSRSPYTVPSGPFPAGIPKQTEEHDPSRQEGGGRWWFPPNPKSERELKMLALPRQGYGGKAVPKLQEPSSLPA